MKQLKEILADESIVNLAVAILAVTIYLILFFFPKMGQLLALSRQGSQLKAEIMTTKVDWANFDSLQRQLLHLNQKKDYYERSLPGEKEVPVVLEYLSSAAKKLEVRISEIKPAEEHQDSKGQIYYGVPILVKAECRYHQLGRFLNELERADRFMKISDIKIKARPERPETLFVQLIIVTYVMS